LQASNAKHGKIQIFLFKGMNHPLDTVKNFDHLFDLTEAPPQEERRLSALKTAPGGQKNPG